MGYECWSQFGSVGDAFADKALSELTERNKINAKFSSENSEKAKSYDALVVRFNALARAFNIVSIVMQNVGEQLK